MNQRSFYFSIAMAIVINVLTLNRLIFAQSIWLDQKHEKSVMLEILKPYFEGENNFTFFTSAYFLSFRFSISPNVQLVGELPFAHGAIKSDFGNNESESTIGNPYIGLEILRHRSSFFAELGVRVPLASQNNIGTAVGLVTDFDRGDAFVDQKLTILGLTNYQTKYSDLFFRLRAGPAFLISTNDRLGADVNLLYSGQLGYGGEQVNVLIGLTGRWNLSDGFGNFSKRSNHQFGFAANFRIGSVRPGIHLRIPVDRFLNELVNYVIGFQIQIGLHHK